MSEWMPLLAGAVLGGLHVRHALSERALPWCAAIAAVLATTLAGEWSGAPYLVIVDGALVVAGILAARIAQRGWLSLRHRGQRVRHVSG